jgi:hypothetical protein
LRTYFLFFHMHIFHNWHKSWDGGHLGEIIMATYSLYIIFISQNAHVLILPVSVSQMTANMFRFGNHNPVLSSFVTYHWVFKKSAAVVVTCGAGTTNTPEHLSSSPVFDGVCVAQYLVFCVVFCIIICSCPLIDGFWIPTLVSSSFS